MRGGLTNSLRLNSESINGNPMPDVQGESSKKIETDRGWALLVSRTNLWLTGEPGGGEETYSHSAEVFVKHVSPY